MAHAIFDVQTALLYAVPQTLDPAKVLAAVNARLRDTGSRPDLQILPGATGENVISLAGGGVHAVIKFNTDPSPADAFELALSSPYIKMKSFDFKAAIASHRATIVINVGDGDVPINAENRQQMARMIDLPGADPLVKIEVLHAILQVVARMAPPMMIDFCPSQTLLTVEELAVTEAMDIPIPFCIHPVFSTSGGQARMSAIHSQFLLGRTLVLEHVPQTLHMATLINIASTLIMKYREGALPMEAGTQVKLDEEFFLQFSEAPADAAHPQGAIIARFTDGSEMGTPPSPADAPERPDGPVDGPTESQRAFQDRIARLKTNTAAPDTPPPLDAPELRYIPTYEPSAKTTGLSKVAMMLFLALALVYGGPYIVDTFVFPQQSSLEAELQRYMDAQRTLQTLQPAPTP